MNSEKGIAQVAALIVLVLGLGAGLYLVSHPTIFKPKAFDNPVAAPPSHGDPGSCNARLASFSVVQPCEDVSNGFKMARFSCSGQITPSGAQQQLLGGGTNCKTTEEWARLALSQCQSFCSVASPQPSGNPGCVNDYQCQSGYTCEGVTCPTGAGGGGACTPGRCVPSVTPAPSSVPVVITIPSPPPQVALPSNDSCSINLFNGQSIAGENFRVSISGQRSNSSSYLSFYARNSKSGSNSRIYSSQVDNFVTTMNTQTMFDNDHPVTLECRIEGGINGPTVYSNTVTVFVRN